MYQFSRAIYRELAPLVDGRGHERVLRAAEACVERLVADPQHFAHPARTLFHDVRMHFPMSTQARVWRIVACYVAAAEAWASRPRDGIDANGNPITCRATTRRGTPCRREPLAPSGYCPSHQHLAETEDVELAAA
jgi:hypothetical protein